MKKTIQNLLLTGCFLFVVSYDSCNLGVAYDRQNRLYPETDFSCMITTVYGKRWERLGLATFSFGTILTFSAFIAWRGKKQSEEKSILDLVRKE
jgi:hypothetical protein